MMPKYFSWGCVAVMAALIGGACSAPPPPCVEGDEPTCPDAGSLPPDGCNSPEEARSADCTLTLCQDREGYISTTEDGGADVDFYSIAMPGNLSVRSLLNVKGGYGGSQQTAVNFSINVLRNLADGGIETVASGNNQRTGGALPKNVEIIRPFSSSNAQLLVRVSDVGGVAIPRVENRIPYKLNLCVVENPDVNEPNDTMPTAIALSPASGYQQGTASGYLATNDDVDKFSFPISAARQIVYLRISSAMMNLMPPLNYRLAYTLKDPAGNPISEGVMENMFLQIDLTTARLAAVAGTYTVEIFGYRMPNQMTPVEGDLRLKYDVEVRVMPDLDMSEGSMGNDTAATARSVNLSLNATSSVNGRLSYVADLEWFKLNFPARSGPAVLRYELTGYGGMGRYPPLSTLPTRQIRVVQEVTTGVTVADRQTNCATRADVCPRSFDDALSGNGMLVNSICRAPNVDPPHCLLAERNEEAQINPLRGQKNFVGAIPVPPNVNSMLLVFGDSGKGRLKFADDRDWTIRVTLEDDPDEAGRPPNNAPQTVNLGNSLVSVQGLLTHGYGRTIEFDNLNEGRGIRGPNDYDATETDIDAYRFNFGGAMGDQTWQLEWLVGNVDGGSAPGGTVALDMLFCDGPLRADGGCSGRRAVLGPRFDSFAPWYLPAEPQNVRVQFTRSQVGNATRIVVEPVACFCFAREYVMSGSFFMNILAVDRTSNDPIPYVVRQSMSAYPGSFANPDGGSTAVSCPASMPNGMGGCRFNTR